jgi:hypothetical protein
MVAGVASRSHEEWGAMSGYSLAGMGRALPRGSWRTCAAQWPSSASVSVSGAIGPRFRSPRSKSARPCSRPIAGSAPSFDPSEHTERSVTEIKGHPWPIQNPSPSLRRRVREPRLDQRELTTNKVPKNGSYWIMPTKPLSQQLRRNASHPAQTFSAHARNLPARQLSFSCHAASFGRITFRQIGDAHFESFSNSLA